MTAPFASFPGAATLFMRRALVVTTLLPAGATLKKSVAPSSQVTALAQTFAVERETESVPLVLLPLCAAPLLPILLAP